MSATPACLPSHAAAWLLFTSIVGGATSAAQDYRIQFDTIHSGYDGIHC